MLKLYTDKSLLVEENRSRVFPLLFDIFYMDINFKNYYSLVDDLNECDIAVFPLDYSYSLKHYSIKTSNFIQESKHANKIIWIYTSGDFGYTLEDASIYNFRLGGFKSKLNDNNIIMPSFVSDPYGTFLDHDFNYIKKTNKPKIGFVGHASSGPFKYFSELKSYLKISYSKFKKKIIGDFQKFYPSSIKRYRYLKRFKKNKAIESNFILRKKYRAGVKDNSEREKTSKEFYQNIFDNPYTFCMRGGGNFSVRFYETLAAGRIPVLLDTDCLLPLENKINWQDHCLIVDSKEAKKLDRKLVDFHSKISDSDFRNMQIKNRELWLNYLTRHSFFKHIHDKF